MNPHYKSEYYSYFTLVVKGKYIQNFNDMLADAGYKSPYGGKSITLVARVKIGHEGSFPVRNFKREDIECTKIKKGSRVFFGIRCSLYKSEGEKKVQFNLKYVRYLEKYLGEEEEEEVENELGKDNGPVF